MRIIHTILCYSVAILLGIALIPFWLAFSRA